MRKFYDIENGAIITENELQAEFDSLKEADPDEYSYTFACYINNCIGKNGTLKEL